MSKESITEWIREKGSPVATLLVAAALIGGCIGMAGRANADPETVESYAFRNATAVCALLASDDSDAGIASIIATLVQHGLSYYQSGEVLGLSALNVCPQYNDRVLDWAHTVTGTGQVSSVWKS
jgi:hypothetical protein